MDPINSTTALPASVKLDIFKLTVPVSFHVEITPMLQLTIPASAPTPSVECPQLSETLLPPDAISLESALSIKYSSTQPANVALDISSSTTPVSQPSLAKQAILGTQPLSLVSVLLETAVLTVLLTHTGEDQTALATTDISSKEPPAFLPANPQPIGMVPFVSVLTTNISQLPILAFPAQQTLSTLLKTSTVPASVDITLSMDLVSRALQDLPSLLELVSAHSKDSSS